jgi:hypothetical protein
MEAFILGFRWFDTSRVNTKALPMISHLPSTKSAANTMARAAPKPAAEEMPSVKRLGPGDF